MYIRSRNHSCNKHQSRGCTSLRRILATERGQTTAEYALVLLAAGSIAMMVVGWAQGSDAIGALFDSVLSRITSLMA